MSVNVDRILTVADLEQMPDDGNRYELFEGELFVSSAPGLPHQRVLTNILIELELFLRANPIGSVWPGPGVIFDNFNAAIPDLVFVNNERIGEIAAAEKVTGPPDLAIEIISSGAINERRDRIVKHKAYGKFGVREYWIVDRYDKTIEIFRLEDGQLRLAASLKPADQLTSQLLPGFSCPVSLLFGE